MNRWWDQSAPATSVCPTCGKPISRKRGNLSPAAHRNAVAAQLNRHVLKHHRAPNPVLAQVRVEEPKA